MTRRGTRRTRAVSLLGLAGVGVGVLVYLAVAGRPRPVTDAEFGRVRLGLSVAEVEELLGGPGSPVAFADDGRAPGHLRVVLDGPTGAWAKAEDVRDPSAVWRKWPSEGRTYWVVRFRDGVVVETCGLAGPVQPSLIERVRRRLGW